MASPPNDALSAAVHALYTPRLVHALVERQNISPENSHVHPRAGQNPHYLCGGPEILSQTLSLLRRSHASEVSGINKHRVGIPADKVPMTISWESKAQNAGGNKLLK